MQVLLDDHVAGAGELGIVGLAHGDRVDRAVAFGVLGAVDEPQQITFVEGAEAVDLVDHAGGVPEMLGQPLGELEAQVHPFGADVEQQIARGAGRVVHGAVVDRQLVQPGGAGEARIQAVPGGRADPDDAAEPGLGYAETDRAPDPTDLGQGIADVRLASRGDQQHEEDAGGGGLADDHL